MPALVQMVPGGMQTPRVLPSCPESLPSAETRKPCRRDENFSDFIYRIWDCSIHTHISSIRTKISENDTFNSFWSGASQAGAGVICHAYKKGMIEVDQALDLIFNEYLVAYNSEMDSWDPGIDWKGQSLGSSFVASFRKELVRAGCESLNAPNYLFATDGDSNAVTKSIQKSVERRAGGF